MKKGSVSMKDGEEPTEVLLALVSSPLMTLKSRGVAKILKSKGVNGKPILLAVFSGFEWDETVGIVPAKELPTVPTEQPTAEAKL